MKQAILNHFEAVFGYGAWLLLIVFFTVIGRFDSLVTVQAAAWFGSIATYITVKVLGGSAPESEPPVAASQSGPSMRPPAG